MTTYTAITDTETGHQKPTTISLIRRLRDNALAIQQGDATAPSLLLGIAAKAAAGGVGTYAFCSTIGGSGFTAGTTYAGSGLKFSGVVSTSPSPYPADISNTGASPSGTWRAMGTATGSTAHGTLFLRIS
jgi:hypothetical protein